jgi:hypothetical protein
MSWEESRTEQRKGIEVGGVRCLVEESEAHVVVGLLLLLSLLLLLLLSGGGGSGSSGSGLYINRGSGRTKCT